MQIEKPHDFKSGVVHEEEVQPKKPQDLKRGGQEEKNHRKFKNMKRWTLF
jgi:hypothetical protein